MLRSASGNSVLSSDAGLVTHDGGGAGGDQHGGAGSRGGREGREGHGGRGGRGGHGISAGKRWHTGGGVGEHQLIGGEVGGHWHAVDVVAVKVGVEGDMGVGVNVLDGAGRHVHAHAVGADVAGQEHGEGGQVEHGERRRHTIRDGVRLQQRVHAVVCVHDGHGVLAQWVVHPKHREQRAGG